MNNVDGADSKTVRQARAIIADSKAVHQARAMMLRGALCLAGVTRIDFAPDVSDTFDGIFYELPEAVQAGWLNAAEKVALVAPRLGGEL